MRLTTIRARIAVNCAAGILLTVVVLVLTGAWQSERFGAAAGVEADRLVATNLDDIATGVRGLVTAQVEAVQQQVDAGLEVARHVAEGEGGFGFDPDLTATWAARNQFTGEVTEVVLPQMTAGGRWFGQEAGFETRQPVVDQVQDLVGGTVTVFQRIEGSGDMLRVATNVRTLDDTRAVGTFIPEFNPDGSANAVVASVLGGETFRGNAFVVTAWYATAYEPIVEDGEVAGMLYVGVPQENVAALRSAVVDAEVGQTGEVIVLGASGDGKGQVRIARDLDVGTPLIDGVDAEGVRYLDALIDGAVLAGGEVVRAAHDVVVEQGDPQPTLLRAVHIPAWDWVIVTRAPEADFRAAQVALSDGRSAMTWTLVVAGLLAAGVFGTAASTIGSRSISRSVGASAEALHASGSDLNRLAGTMETASRQTGRDATMAARSSEQIGANVASVATAIEELQASVREISRHTSDASQVATDAVGTALTANATISRLGEASAEIGEVVSLITTIAEQTNLLALNATIEAARAGDAGRGFAVVANEVKGLALETQSATERIAPRIAAIQTQTDEAVTAIEHIAAVIEQIADLQVTIASAVEEQTVTAEEISRSVNEAATGAGQISGNVGAVADAADRSTAAAAEAATAAVRLLGLADELQALVVGSPGTTASGRPADGGGPTAGPSDRPQDLGPSTGDPARGHELAGV